MSFDNNTTVFMQFKVANAYLAGGADQIFPTVPQAPEGGDPDTADGVYVNLDQWDGFQAERREISQAILDANEGQGVENFVVITGDIHSYIAGHVRENYDDQTPPVPETEEGGDLNPNNRLLGTCFVCGSVTSSNLVELATGAGNADFPQVDERFLESEDGLSALQSAFQEPSNPHIEFFNSSTHGCYNVMEVTQEKPTCAMFGVETTQQPPQNGQPQKSVLARFEAPNGLVQLQRTDIVPTP